MNEFDAYVMYLALKQHFTTDSYDYIKYQGKIKASAKTFNARNDKYSFVKLSKQKNVEQFIIANLLVDPHMWIGDMVSQRGIDIYNDYRRRHESLTYTFKQELEMLKSNFDDNFIISDNEIPEIVTLFLREKISLETFTILLKLTNCVSYFDKKLHDTVIWNKAKNKFSKYAPFLSFDEKKCVSIIQDHFSA